MWSRLDTFAGRVPEWLLPVARDEYGNLFTVSLRDEDRSSVWFWDHEEESDDEDDEPTEDNLTCVADDWPIFLQSLGPLPNQRPAADSRLRDQVGAMIRTRRAGPRWGRPFALMLAEDTRFELVRV
jgi:hypothetical protein